VEAALKDAGKRDSWGVMFAPMSRFGVIELSRAQLTRPIANILCDESGGPSAETTALAALRAIERETATARGRRIVARVAAPVAAWLDAGDIPWRAALAARIGAHWEIETIDAAAPDAIDVRAT
jgi:Ribonuclease G/E